MGRDRRFAQTGDQYYFGNQFGLQQRGDGNRSDEEGGPLGGQYTQQNANLVEKPPLVARSLAQQVDKF